MNTQKPGYSDEAFFEGEPQFNPRVFNLQEDPTHEFSTESIFQRMLDSSNPHVCALKRVYALLDIIEEETKKLEERSEAYIKQTKTSMQKIRNHQGILQEILPRLMKVLREANPLFSEDKTLPTK